MALIMARNATSKFLCPLTRENRTSSRGCPMINRSVLSAITDNLLLVKCVEMKVLVAEKYFISVYRNHVQQMGVLWNYDRALQYLKY